MADIINLADVNPTRHGATENEWYLLAVIMGHCADLLPIVSDPKAIISPQSAIKQVGKIPSTLNYLGQAIGMIGWPEHITKPEEIDDWARRDFSMGMNCRVVRALDIDVADKALAAAIRDFILAFFGIQLPERNRANSGKFLLAFIMTGEFGKRAIKVKGGIIEFLANGCQFAVLGRHPSGVHYQWPAGFPPEFPALATEKFEDLWAALEKAFATEPATDAGFAGKAEKLHQAITNDPIAQHLISQGAVKSFGRHEGRLHITCPFQAEHTDGIAGSDTATVYWPESTGGYKRGHFDCKHAHCADRTDQQFKDAVGYVEIDPMLEFEAIADEAPEVIAIEGRFTDLGPDASIKQPLKKPRFYGYTPAESHHFPKPTWFIKGVLPQASLTVLYGESTAGKTFVALDLALAISRGVPWRGRKTRKARVTYIAAEDDIGVRLRIAAYCVAHEIDEATIELRVIYTAANLMEKADIVELCRQINDQGGAGLVIADTLAQCVAGANENSGEDMGEALKNCRGINTATKAMVLLVHHAGKDLAKGARGWSGLKAAADCEIEVSMLGNGSRLIRVTKLKNGITGQEFGFELVTLTLGVDEDGDDITSCFTKETLIATKKEQPKGAWQGAVWRTIKGFEQRAGIEIAAVVAEVKRITPADTDNRGSDRRKGYITRAIADMAARGLFRIEDSCISLN
jgi:hypothetical protein